MTLRVDSDVAGAHVAPGGRTRARTTLRPSTKPCQTATVVPFGVTARPTSVPGTGGSTPVSSGWGSDHALWPARRVRVTRSPLVVESS